jgi:hypothetical protein
MRVRCAGPLFVIVALALTVVARGATAQAPAGAQYIGTWAGMWDGAGSGGFELTLDKAQNGPLVGRVVVNTDGGNYEAELKSIAFNGPKMTAKYEFPLDTSAEIAVTATFEDKDAKGTWSMKSKGQDTELAGGTFSVSRK